MNYDFNDPRQIWALFGITILTIVGGWITTIIGVRRTRNAAEEAVSLSFPTGNGFAKHVKDSLSRIERDMSSALSGIQLDLVRIENKVDHHIQAHADREIANRESPRS